MPASIECVAEAGFPVCVVRVTGTLDPSGASAMREFLLSCLTDHPTALVVDLAGLSVADDVLLDLFSVVARRAAEWPGAELLLCAPGPQVVDALNRTGVSQQVLVCQDRNSAFAVAARQPEPRRLRQRLAAGADAPRQARALISWAATAWRLPPDPMQVAQVIATELVTNAVRHARPPMDVSVVLRDGLLHVAVGDGDPTPPRRRVIMTERDDHGRGLQLVDGLAAAWGYLPVRAGKVVWASVPTS